MNRNINYELRIPITAVVEELCMYVYMYVYIKDMYTLMGPYFSLSSLLCRHFLIKHTCTRGISLV